MTHPILYHKGKKGALYSWKIWVEGADIVTEYGLVDGKKQIARKTATPKNVGRSNETSPEQQAQLEAESMWTFKRDRKYAETPEGAEQTLFLPMLAKDFYKRLKKVTYPCTVQPKYDGVRCLASWDGDKVVLTSRSGKPYFVPHLQEQLEKWLPKGCVVDGEIYKHGLNLQQINRLVKKYRAGETEALDYLIYDLPLGPDGKNLPGEERAATLYIWFDANTRVARGEGCGNLKHAPARIASSEEEVEELHQLLVSEGYEGAIVRLNGDYPYLWGYRSDGLLKVKSFMDDEFLVTGHEYGVGKFAEIPIWKCQTKEGREFSCTLKGKTEARKVYGEDPNNFHGKYLKVGFFDYTEDNIPRFPVGIAFRLEEDMS